MAGRYFILCAKHFHGIYDYRCSRDISSMGFNMTRTTEEVLKERALKYQADMEEAQDMCNYDQGAMCETYADDQQTIAELSAKLREMERIGILTRNRIHNLCKLCNEQEIELAKYKENEL